ncbi:MAG: hypothetical protein QOF05_286 [Sphingomonadales bacterium]|nr:hypothetical protein [Sphingomonadales bacterium]
MHSSSPVDEFAQHGLQLDVSLDGAGLTSLEGDPRFVESIQHLDAGQRIPHSLGFEESCPDLARNGFDSDGVSENFFERGCDILWSNATRPLQLNHACAGPVLLKQFRAYAPHVCRRHHWDWLVERGRKLSMIPLSRAEATSHSAFSMNQAGLRNAIGIESPPSAPSISVRWVSRFDLGDWAPIVDRQTTLFGRADSSATFTAAIEGRLYRWEFERGDEQLEVTVEGPLIVNDPEVMLRAVLDGVGIGYIYDRQVRPYVAEGKVVHLLREWTPPVPGFYL